MNRNNLINHMKQWCIRKATDYHKAYGAHGGVTYVGYQTAYELQFKLSTLMDRDFESANVLKSEILAMLNVHYTPALVKPQNNTAKQIVEKVNREFCEHLEMLLSQQALPMMDIPYTRVIVGAEAEALRARFREIWGYVNTSYWYPLMGDSPEEIPDKFFIMADCLAPYQKQLEQRIGLPQNHLYCYGEENIAPDHCVETAELSVYGGLECMYTDKDFTWAIYISHEDTVAFAGAIVPMVKELLGTEKEHWNQFE